MSLSEEEILEIMEIMDTDDEDSDYSDSDDDSEPLQNKNLLWLQKQPRVTFSIA